MTRSWRPDSTMTVSVSGLLVGLLFLWLSFRSIDLAIVGRALRETTPGWSLLALGAGILFVVCKAWRWELILRPVTQCRFRFVLCLTYVGTAANLLLSHSGEVLRAIGVSRRQGVAASSVLAGIGVERLFDLAAALLLLGFIGMVDPVFSDQLGAAAAVMAALVAIGGVAVLAWLRVGPVASGYFSRLLGWLPARVQGWTAHQLSQSAIGVGVANQPRLATQVLLVSLAQWISVVGAVWLSCRAVGSDVPVGAAVAVLVLMMVGLVLPSAPMQLGTTQLAFTTGLAWAGAPADEAFAASLIYTICMGPFTIGVGMFGWLMGCGNGDARRN